MANGTENHPESFKTKIASTGDAFEILTGKSNLHILIETGFRVKNDCSNGRRGTCKTRYLEGAPDHIDTSLGPEERGENLAICVSRSKSAEIIIDLPPPQKSQSPYVSDGPVAVVETSICVACLTCVRACTGCGLCAAVYPTGALGISKFTDREAFSRVNDFYPNNGIADGTPELGLI